VTAGDVNTELTESLHALDRSPNS